MLTLLKKLFTPLPTLQSSTLNSQLVEQLSILIDNCELNTILYSPENKLYLLNTYTISFNELTSTITSTVSSRQLSSINIHAYFNNSSIDIRMQLSKLITYINLNKINAHTEHDLFEICTAYQDLVTIGEHSV
jgi:hypothetical protein